jgi:TRAP-type C4-dicarboxylate transport system permease small subunit
MVNDMKKLVSAFNTIFDNTVKYFCYLAAATLVMTAIVISVDVILRYTLNKPLMWVFEGTEYALLFITFLSATFVLQQDQHVKLDLVLNAMGNKLRARFSAFISFIMAVVCLVITCSSTQYLIYLYQNDVMIIKYYTIPQFTIYFIIPIGFFLLFIQSLKRAYNFLRKP